MAASAIDEAVRNCVAVGADPRRIAILDNFCWGDCERPETLGSLVRAALACHDVSLALGTPFISGKDSLNNEFSYTDAAGKRQTIAIPAVAADQRDGAGRRRGAVRHDGPQAAGQLALSRRRDEERAGRLAFCAGERSRRRAGADGRCRSVPGARSRRCTRRFDAGLVRACHDLSEGGLAVAVAEMAFAGGCGRSVDLAACVEWRRAGRRSVQRIEHAIRV